MKPGRCGGGARPLGVWRQEEKHDAQPPFCPWWLWWGGGAGHVHARYSLLLKGELWLSLKSREKEYQE